MGQIAQFAKEEAAREQREVERKRQLVIRRRRERAERLRTSDLAEASNSVCVQLYIFTESCRALQTAYET